MKLISLFFFVTGKFDSAQCQFIHQFENLNSVFGTQSIYQDSRGYLWFGTTNGLFRFDGNLNVVRSYYNNSKDVHSIANSRIWGITEDRDSNIWIATYDGISRYSYATNNFVSFKNKLNDQKSISNNEVFGLSSDKEGNIWAGVTDKGLNKIISVNAEKDLYEFQHFKHEASDQLSFPLKNGWVFTFDNNNYCWVSDGGSGICVFNASDPDKKVIYRSINKPNEKGEQIDNIQCIYFDKNLNGVWLLSPDGSVDLILYKNDPVSENLNVIHLRDLFTSQLHNDSICPNRMLIDSKGNYWIGHTGFGLSRFNCSLDNNKVQISNLQHFRASEQHNDSISSDVIKCLYEDHSGNIWIGTDKNVSKFRNEQRLFQMAINNNAIGLLHNRNVLSVTSDLRNTTWFGTLGSGVLLACNESKVKTLDLNQLNKNFQNSNNQYVGMINDFLFDKDSSLLIATDAGVYKISKQEQIKYLSGSTGYPQIISYCTNSSNQIKEFENTRYFICLCKTPGNNIISGTTSGLFILNENLTHAEPIELDADAGSAAKRIRSLLALNNRIVLVGCDNGLYFFDCIKKSKIDYSTLLSRPDEKITTRITSFAKINDNEAWITTISGLYKLNLQSRILSLAALSGEYLCRVLYDNKSGNTFVSSTSGIFKLNKRGEIINYNQSDGLFTNKFMDGAGCITTNGALCFGSYAGVNSFYADSIPVSMYKTPSVLITDFFISGESVLKSDSTYALAKESFLNNEIIQLSDKQNDLSIQFAAMNYLEHGKNYYEYKLNSSDTNWIDNKYENIVRLQLTPLRNSWFFPGSYSINVRAKTPGGYWMEARTPILISIKPAFTKSIEFLSLLAISILAAIIYIVRYLSQVRLREQLAKQEKLLAVERERNRISRDLHDDLGAGLSSVAMMTNQMKQLVTDEQAQDRAWEISNEANDLVTRMREIIWSMSSKNDTVENLVAYINKYSFNYLEKNFIECKIMGEKDFPATLIDGDSRRNIFLVVKETLHNLIKHSGATEVVLNYERFDNRIQLSICDNGKGFDMENIHRFGNGLLNMKQRMENAGGTYDIESAPGKGVTTRLNFSITTAKQN